GGEKNRHQFGFTAARRTRYEQVRYGRIARQETTKITRNDFVIPIGLVLRLQASDQLKELHSWRSPLGNLGSSSSCQSSDSAGGSMDGFSSAVGGSSMVRMKSHTS